jgi:hypothetical protein
MLPVWEIETFTCGADHVGHLVVITLTEARLLPSRPPSPYSRSLLAMILDRLALPLQIQYILIAAVGPTMRVSVPKYAAATRRPSWLTPSVIETMPVIMHQAHPHGSETLYKEASYMEYLIAIITSTTQPTTSTSTLFPISPFPFVLESCLDTNHSPSGVPASRVVLLSMACSPSRPPSLRSP